MEYSKGTLVGKCMTMCPPKEMETRAKETVINYFERDQHGQFNPSLAVKQYHRSEAGAQFREEDLRPLPVLQMTVSHIISHVLTTKPHSPLELTAQLYARDRFRSIQQDLTIQDLHGPEVIEILEIMCLFYISSGIKFVYQSIDDFSFTQNLEQITKVLLTLDNEYDLHFQKTGCYSKRESMFRAIHLAVYLTSHEFMRNLILIPNAIVKSKPITQLMKLRQLYQEKNITKFVSMLQELPVQLASIIVINAKSFWEDMAEDFRKSFRTNVFHKSFIDNVLFASSVNAKAMMESFKIVPFNSAFKFEVSKEPEFQFLPNCIVPQPLYEHVTSIQFSQLLDIESDDLSEIVDTVDERTPEPQHVFENHEEEEMQHENNYENEHEPESEEDQEGEQINEQEEIPEEVKEEPPTCEIVQQKVEMPTENIQQIRKIHIPKILEQVRLTPITKEETECIDNQIISKIDLSMVLPSEIGCDSFSTVNVIFDNSFCSHFFAESLGYDISSDNTIIIAEKFKIKEYDFYFTIKKLTGTNEERSLINCINCSSQKVTNTTEFTLKNGFSPSIALQELLCKITHQSLSPILTLNLSETLKKTISRAFDCLDTSVWRWSTANSVINAINHIIAKFSQTILTEKLLYFVVPSVFEMIDWESIMSFKNFIDTIILPNIDDGESLTLPHGSTWPTVIRKGTNIQLDDFLLPISAQFNEDLFISELLIDDILTEPTESIDPSYV